jgi:L-alanine-DL-glutamate epimerase-like enolase superfamily enzyme
MPDTPLSIPTHLRRDLTINAIKSTIVDVPTVRKHKLSSLSVTAQSYVVVELRLANGVIGIGEAATLGGPRWSEESVESIKATIDTYLAPALIGAAPDRLEAARACTAGRYANVSVFDVADHDELHAILSSLPLFPFMDIIVTPLARHPSTIE